MSDLDAREAARAWFAKSDSDLRSARLLMEPEPPETDVAAFLSQQAAEKCLKGFLAYHGEEPPRTHNLALLVDLAGEHEKQLLDLHDIADPLGRYAVEVRYPFGAHPPGREEAERVVHRSGQICEAVRADLSLDT